ncbi:MAG TPA: NADH-quinone oxidoreductase subunit NuoH [Planctomycetes bacterium]|nr:NADH-quinone oxidoreductase subunit NuoH [Planctomycetota bacterium]
MDGNFISHLLSASLPPGFPFWGLALLAAFLGALCVVGFVSILALVSVWLERKIAGHIQARLGPMRTGGWHGWSQTLADAIKLLTKEDVILRGADPVLFRLAPALVMGSALAMFAVLPFAPGVQFADIDLGVYFLLAVASLTTIGVIMAGWGSNNKWSLYGAMREAAQATSYEIPLALSLIPPILHFGTFSLLSATEQQSGWGGMQWYIFSDAFWVAIPSFFLFFTAALAENKRAPFDLPESESELVAGFHTEYSGLRFAFFFLEEYAAMFAASAVATAYWLGGWNFPGMTFLSTGSLWLPILGALAFLLKAMFLVCVMIWIRWTLPRLRIDQVMTLGWKYLTPLALGIMVAAAGWEAWRASL